MPLLPLAKVNGVLDCFWQSFPGRFRKFKRQYSGQKGKTSEDDQRENFAKRPLDERSLPETHEYGSVTMCNTR